MKKSIIVMMVAVLLVSALFVSCKQEIATPQDSLGTVAISLPSSRDLIPDTPQSIIPDVNSWWYVATKTDSGYYKTGETEWNSLAAMQANQQVGTTFSAGEWSFSFYGYATAPDGKPSDPKADAVYYAENILLTVVAGTAPNYIDVVLQGGDGIGFGKLRIHDISIPEGLTLKLKIGAGEETVITLPYEINLAAEGEQAYELKVYSGDELVGSGKTSINVSKGYNYGITGSIEWLDAQGIVVIKTVEYRQAVASDTKTVVPGEDTTFTTAAAPDGAQTTVTFGAGVLSEGSKTLTTTVTGSESAGAFVISAGSSVASIDLSLAGGATFTGTATVTTKIAKGLHDVSVVYNGTGDAPTDVVYDSGTGILTFKTSHFSQFIVVSTDEIIVSDGTPYATLGAFAAAVNAGNSFAGKTVTLMKDVNLSAGWAPIGDGHRYQSNQNVFSGTFDGKGHTISGLNSNGFDPEISVVDDNEYTYGLFGYVKNGTVRNVILEDVRISQTVGYQLENAGGVVGYLDGGKVENCAVSGSVSGWNGIGGIVGRAYGTCTIENCTNAAGVVGKKNVAGVVGFVNPLASGTIKVLDNSNSGNVTREESNENPKAGAAAGIACFGCAADNELPKDSGSVYIKNNSNTGIIKNEPATDRVRDYAFPTSHSSANTTGTVDVQLDENTHYPN